MTRVLSGIQPTSEPHLGNYLGALRRWPEDQHDGERFFFLADLHALTVPQEPEVLARRTLNLAATLIAVGIDPEIATIYAQSHVPEHAQLSWLIECTAAYGELSRMTQFKEKSDGRDQVSVGLFSYPCLMAADILLYDIAEVPVGEDQRQHLELTRDVAERFNNRYGETFVVPKATLPKAGARVRDLQDPSRKMSKSADADSGIIWLYEQPDSIMKKFKRAVTDSDGEVRYDPENKPGVSNLLEILSACTGDSPEDLAENYEQYGPLKVDTAEAVIETLEPVQTRYAELTDDPYYVMGVLAAGAEHAREIASRTLARAKKNIGLLQPNDD